ncbi:hypothetical protein G6011_07481 [Alternaria panax]|uniref:Uncharacterized protein n=1 Tax=Alternaria panax TaxID=48097 RepID=A0AAD4FHH0_9PLEO|nr:hypothetical protein G6011_07481 [Alternaria panax]
MHISWDITFPWLRKPSFVIALIINPCLLLSSTSQSSELPSTLLWGLFRHPSEYPDASSESPRGLKKAKKVGTTDATTAVLKGIGVTERVPESSKWHDAVTLQQGELNESNVDDIQLPNTITPVPEHASDDDVSGDDSSTDDSESQILWFDDEYNELTYEAEDDDILTAEIAYADEDAGFDAYMDKKGVDGIYERWV